MSTATGAAEVVSAVSSEGSSSAPLSTASGGGMLASLWNYFSTPVPAATASTSPSASPVESPRVVASPPATPLGKASSTALPTLATPLKHSTSSRRPLTPGRISVVRTSSTNSSTSSLPTVALSPRGSITETEVELAPNPHLVKTSYVAAYTPVKLPQGSLEFLPSELVALELSHSKVPDQPPPLASSLTSSSVPPVASLSTSFTSTPSNSTNEVAFAAASATYPIIFSSASSSSPASPSPTATPSISSASSTATSASSAYPVIYSSINARPPPTRKDTFLESLNSLPSSLDRQPPSSPAASPNTTPKMQSKAEISQSEMYLRDVIEQRGLTLDARALKMQRLLSDAHVNLVELRKLAWNGVPEIFRPLCWQLLLGYSPLVRERRAATLSFKREKYWESAKQFFDVDDSSRSDYERSIFHQIAIDVPRTHPGITLYHIPEIQKRLHRILYVWAIRHPASGYVQGVNELVTPFIAVFARQYLRNDIESELVRDEVQALSPTVLDEIEADSYGCMSTYIDSIQDSYTAEQPGIQRMLFRLQEIVQKIDSELELHLGAKGVPFIQFAFRWMNCLLMREIPLRLVYRVWDTYLAEAEQFGTLHIYVCAAFLLHWSDELKQMDFQEIVLHLQHLPTAEWSDKDVETLISQAYIWMTLYNDAKGHLGAK